MRQPFNFQPVLPALRRAALLTVLAAPCAYAGDAYISAGASRSQYTGLTALGELDLVGVTAESRMSLPWNFYGLMQVRAEDGEGAQLGGTTQNDYLRLQLELGWDFPLFWGFQGGLGVNYTQVDLDVAVTIAARPVNLSVSNEDYGGRGRLSHDLGGWATISAEGELNLVEEAIAGIFELESGRRFGPWGVALRFGIFPEITQTALLLRYHYGGKPPLPHKTPEPPPEPCTAPDEQWDGGDSTQSGNPACVSGTAATVAPEPEKPVHSHRPEWADEKEEPEKKYVPKPRAPGDTRPDWADDPAVE